jgi:hypothetical protein
MKPLSNRLTHTLDGYLSDLEERIHPEVEEALLASWQDFALGETRLPNGSGIFSPRRERPSPPGVDWPKIWVNDTLDDFEQMALQQFQGCSAALEAGSGALMAVRCNYGTGIMSSLFGAELFIMERETDTLPTTRPLAGGKDAIREVLKRGIPDLQHSLGGKVLAMGARFVELMSRYPKVARYVYLFHPDMQGPIDICELLWGSSLFIDIIDHPDLVKSLLDLVTETYIQFMRAWMKIAPIREDWAVHWGLLHRGRIMLRDDSAMNYSPAMFAEFIQPYDQRLLAEFGGGAIHFCGRGDHFIQRMSTTPGLYAINITQPELNNMEKIFSNTIDKGIQLLELDRNTAEAALSAGRDLYGRVHCG